MGGTILKIREARFWTTVSLLISLTYTVVTATVERSAAGLRPVDRSFVFSSKRVKFPFQTFRNRRGCALSAGRAV